MTVTRGAERARVDGFGRLDLGLRQAGNWYLWGPYLSERHWGTVHEDYSADGDAWTYLPHDHARSRAYRWGEDGLAGFCDIEQRLCLALGLWNGRDPILKERAFGLTGAEGSHGEDVKDYWWYLDALPSHAWNSWRYHYPQRAFPYRRLLDENRRRSKFDFEYELLDTGVFDDDGYWIVDVSYAKADPTDVLMTIGVTNAGPDRELLHVLPTLWYRNTWSWDGTAAPTLAATAAGMVAVAHPFLGDLELLAGPAPQGGGPELLFCANETNVALSTGSRVARGGPRTASTTMLCPGPTPSTRGGGAASARRGTGSRWTPARRSSCGCGCVVPAPGRSRPRRWARTSPGWWTSGAPRPTSFTPNSPRPRRRPTRPR